jgi:hypothetical protein
VNLESAYALRTGDVTARPWPLDGPWDIVTTLSQSTRGPSWAPGGRPLGAPQAAALRLPRRRRGRRPSRPAGRARRTGGYPSHRTVTVCYRDGQSVTLPPLRCKPGSGSHCRLGGRTAGAPARPVQGCAGPRPPVTGRQWPRAMTGQVASDSVSLRSLSNLNLNIMIVTATRPGDFRVKLASCSGNRDC